MVCIYCSHPGDASPSWRGDINHGVCYMLVTGREAHTRESDTAQGKEGGGWTGKVTCGRM